MSAPLVLEAAPALNAMRATGTPLLRNTPRVMALLCRLAMGAMLVAMLASATGCAANSVQAYQRENLADPIMSFKQEAKREARRTKAFEAREGSTGGNGGEGGGCACK